MGKKVKKKNKNFIIDIKKLFLMGFKINNNYY
jgi:hypothetical protein